MRGENERFCRGFPYNLHQFTGLYLNVPGCRAHVPGIDPELRCTSSIAAYLYEQGI